MPQSVKQATVVPQQVAEQITQKQPVAQEPPAVESTTPPVAPATQEDRRRRHGQDRQRSKEQSTAAPVTVPTPAPAVEVEPAAATPVPVVAQNDEVNPEDLPPLEYAELQKANSRRRRRRHSSSPVAPVAAASTPLAVTPKTITPELPSAPVVATPTPRCRPSQWLQWPQCQRRHHLPPCHVLRQRRMLPFHLPLPIRLPPVIPLVK